MNETSGMFTTIWQSVHSLVQVVVAFILWISGGGVTLWLIQRYFTRAERVQERAERLQEREQATVHQEHADLHQLIETLQNECKRMAEDARRQTDETAAQRVRGDKWQEIAERLQPLVTTQKLEIWLSRRTRRDVAQSLERALAIIHTDTPGCEVIVGQAVEKLREDIILPAESENA